MKVHWWQWLGIPIIIVNIIRLIWMLNPWYQRLWLSQWIGIYQGICVIDGFRSKIRNGAYIMLGFLPCIAFLLNLTTNADIWFYLNHFPHLIILFIFKKKTWYCKIILLGIRIAFIIILTWINLTFYLAYIFNFEEAAINTTTHILFPLALFTIIIWYCFWEISLKKMIIRLK